MRIFPVVLLTEKPVLCNSRLTIFELHLQITVLNNNGFKVKIKKLDENLGRVTFWAALPYQSLLKTEKKNRRNALPGPSSPIFSLQQWQERCYLEKVLEYSQCQQQIPPSFGILEGLTLLIPCTCWVPDTCGLLASYLFFLLRWWFCVLLLIYNFFHLSLDF